MVAIGTQNLKKSATRNGARSAFFVTGRAAQIVWERRESNPSNIGILAFRFSRSGEWSHQRDPGHEKTTYRSIGIGECLRHVVENQ
jgi:hypothetical protein